MTENEAKEWLRAISATQRESNHTSSLEVRKEALYMAIQALEKQIPKKPRFYAHNYHCSECDNLVGNNEFAWQRFLYCDKCGTKIDWSE